MLFATHYRYWIAALMIVAGMGWLPESAQAAPRSYSGYAARYRPGLMERVARNRNMALQPCQVASPFEKIGTWITVVGSKRGVRVQCQVIDVCNPAKRKGQNVSDCDVIKSRKIVVEFSHQTAAAVCGSVVDPPSQCPVTVTVGGAPSAAVQPVAPVTATRTQAKPQAAVVTAEQRATAARVAASQAGKAWRYGAAGPNAFDCSGLAVYAYGQVGYRLPRSSREMARIGTPVTYAQLQPGDLLFYATTGKGVVTHVTVYIGNGKMASANNSRVGVQINSMWAGYWTPRFMGARRP